jgi:hypothetical protein
MPIAKAGVRRVRGGYLLEPLNAAARPIVDFLYCPVPGHRGERTPIYPGRPPRDFVARIVEVAAHNGYRVRVRGTPRRPILHVDHRNPSQAPLVPPLERSVDLKWSLWSADPDTWVARGVVAIFDAMRAAFVGTGPAVQLSTSPRKEIRHGSVLISEGRARGHFSTEWDDLDSLAETLSLLDDDGHWKDRTGMGPEELAAEPREYRDGLDREAFAESVPFSRHTLEPGLDRDFDVRAGDFDELLARVDAEEAALLEADRAAWEELMGIYRPAPAPGGDE